jgi:hypothetical protein
MAAGLGFKDFVTGEVLTAADVDGYLMQGIWVFASAAARDSAVTSPQEGNFAYLKDTNTTTYYTGSAWTNLDTTGMVNPMTTTGDTIYSSSGSTPARLGIGSTGDVLTVAGGVPTWAAPASGGGMTLLSTTTLSGASTNITVASNTYKNLVVYAYGINPSSNIDVYVQLNTVTASTYNNLRLASGSGGTTFAGVGANQAGIWLNQQGTAGFKSGSTDNEAIITLYDCNSTVRKAAQANVIYYTDSNAHASLFANVNVDLTSAITDVKFLVASGTFNAGTVQIYGVK